MDRIIALGLRRPLQIPLTQFDCTQAPIDEEDLQEEFARSQVYDYGTKRALAHILIALFRFAVVLSETINITYPQNGSPQFPVSADTNENITKVSLRVERSKKDLSTWFESTNGTLNDKLVVQSIHESVTLYLNIMLMYY